MSTRMINADGATARKWLAEATQRWKETLASGASEPLLVLYSRGRTP